MNKSTLLIILLVFSVHSAVFAEMYQWKDENGNVVFSDKPRAIKHKAVRLVPGVSKSPVRSIESSTEYERYTGDIPSIKILHLLRSRQFDELNSLLQTLIDLTKEDVLKEKELFAAFNTFESVDASYGKYFEKWLDEYPVNQVPYLARAKFHYRRAMSERGGKWASETKESQFKAMYEFLAKVVSDLDKAIVIDADNIVPYSLYISVLGHIADDEKLAAALQAALEVSPYSYAARKRYIHFSKPRWGGSYEQMQVVIDAAQEHADKNPRLTLLRGVPYADAASMRSKTNSHTLALELYDKALEFGENEEALLDRGVTYYRLEKYDEANADFSRVIELDPSMSRAYQWRSKIYYKQGMYQQAYDDIEIAGLLSPTSGYVQRTKEKIANKYVKLGYDLAKQRKFQPAIDYYNKALRITPGDSYLHYRRARAYVNLNNLDMAKADLEKAISLNPDDYDYYALIDWVLAKKKDWQKIISYWDNYIERHPDNGRAYVERGGAYFRSGNVKAAVQNAKLAADLGDVQGKETYEKYKHLVQ